MSAHLWPSQEEAAGRIGDELGVQPAWTDLTDDNGCAVFASADGSTQFLVQASSGRCVSEA